MGLRRSNEIYEQPYEIWLWLMCLYCRLKLKLCTAHTHIGKLCVAQRQLDIHTTGIIIAEASFDFLGSLCK